MWRRATASGACCCNATSARDSQVSLFSIRSAAAGVSGGLGVLLSRYPKGATGRVSLIRSVNHRGGYFTEPRVTPLTTHFWAIT